MSIDWQTVAMTVITALCSIVWWEVRNLRKAKHENAQVLQWVVMCIAILSRHAGIELPPLTRVDE